MIYKFTEKLKNLTLLLQLSSGADTHSLAAALVVVTIADCRRYLWAAALDSVFIAVTA